MPTEGGKKKNALDILYRVSRGYILPCQAIVHILGNLLGLSFAKTLQEIIIPALRYKLYNYVY